MNKIGGFTINIYKDEDGDWLAHFVEMPNISAFSDTPEHAFEELETAWEGIKESCSKHNQAFPYTKDDDCKAHIPLPVIPNLRYA